MTNDGASHELVWLGKRFHFNFRTVEVLVEGLDPADWERSPGGAGGNNAHWILGHIVAARRMVLRRLGSDEPEADWEKIFDMGAQPEGTREFPSVEDLMSELEATDQDFFARLSGLSEEQAEADFGRKLPDKSKTLLEGLAFFHFHESYHLGQLGLLRRMAGKPGFA